MFERQLVLSRRHPKSHAVSDRRQPDAPIGTHSEWLITCCALRAARFGLR
jgi:hypothetical protein